MTRIKNINSIIFIAVQYFIGHVFHIVFTHQLIGKCVVFVNIVNSAAMNMDVQMFLEDTDLVSSGYKQ